MSDVSKFSVNEFVDVKDIRDDVVILKDGGMRAVLMASSVNFALKSSEEQDAIIYQFQGAVNSLDFSIQIVVASRKFNIDPYIKNLNQRQKEQENELLRLQTIEYIEFVKGLSELTNIMTSSFYVVVPYGVSSSDQASGSIGLIGKLFGGGKKKQQTPKEESAAKESGLKDGYTDQEFTEIKNQLWQRVEFVAGALSGCGVRTVPLKSPELLELYYKLYNPGVKGGLDILKSKETQN